MDMTLVAGGTGKNGRRVAERTWVEAIRAGHLELSGDAAESIVDADDIAEVVATVLTAEGHIGQLCEVTGPRLPPFAEAVQVIGQATGREVSFERVDGTHFADGSPQAGMPSQEPYSLAELFTGVVNAHNAHLTDGVYRALGRSAREFSNYVRRTAATGVWHG